MATHCIRQFPLHFPSRASPRAITFKLESSNGNSYTVCRHFYKEMCEMMRGRLGGEIVGMLEGGRLVELIEDS